MGNLSMEHLPDRVPNYVYAPFTLKRVIHLSAALGKAICLSVPSPSAGCPVGNCCRSGHQRRKSGYHRCQTTSSKERPMTADQAKATADMLAAVWEGEFPATCQVLAAVNS